MIWQATMDRRYDCRVDRVSEYEGILIMTDTVDSKELLREPVTLSYGAPFGADVADVEDWQQRCMAAVAEAGE